MTKKGWRGNDGAVRLPEVGATDSTPSATRTRTGVAKGGAADLI